MPKGLTPEQILQLPAAVDIPTAGLAFGYGKTKAYQMARRGQFPCDVLPMGSGFRVTRAAICEVLGIKEPPPAVAPPAESEAA